MADETKRIIFELEVNNSKLGVELATINDRLANAKKLQSDWNKELAGLREGTKEYANAAKNVASASENIRALNAEAKKTTEALKLSEAVPGSYNALKSEIKLTREALDKLAIGSDAYNKTEGELNTLLTKEIEIRTAQKSLFQERIKGAINESDVTKTLQQEYKALVLQMQKLDVGSAEFNKLAKEAGALKDKIGDVKEATKSLATGSNLQQFGNILGGIKGDLTGLNFEDAAGKAKQLADVAKSMTFVSAVESAKALGATLLETGKALLNNPLFIIGAAIVAVGVALYQLNKRAEENKKAFDESSKSLKEYEKGLRNLEGAANDSADALAVSQGKITDAELARNKRKRQLDADLIKAQEELDEQLQATRDKKELTDESRDILQRRAIADNIEKVKLLNKIAASDLEKIQTDAIVAEADRRYKLFEDRQKDIEKAIEQRKEELESTEEIITEAAKKRFLKQNEEDKKKYEAEAKLKEEILKLEFEYQQKFDAAKKAAFDKQIQQLSEATKLEDEYLNTKFENEIQKEKDAQDVILDNEILTEEKKQALIAASEKRITQIKAAEIEARLQIANTTFGQLASLEAAFNTDSKAGATAQGLINTYLSATKALGAYPPPLSFIAAGVATAAGLAQVAKINGVQFYEGGFTERGNPREATRNLGPRPYIYHKNEYIVPDKVLSTPEGARHVMELETMRKGSGNRHSNLTGYADGGFADRALTDSVNAEIQTRESMAEVVAQQKIFVAVEDINTGQRSVQVTESRNTI